jgi:hypothetical protein
MDRLSRLTRAMAWKPPTHIDEEISGWMKGKGWEVNTSSEYDARKRVYTWFHEPQSGPAVSLGISREVLDEFPAWAVLHHLDRLNVAAEIRRRPAARIVMVQKDGTVVLDELPNE